MKNKENNLKHQEEKNNSKNDNAENLPRIEKNADADINSFNGNENINKTFL